MPGSLYFSAADIYPQYDTDSTSDRAVPSQEDQSALANSENASSPTITKKKTYNIGMAVLLLIVLVFLFGFSSI